MHIQVCTSIRIGNGATLTPLQCDCFYSAEHALEEHSMQHAFGLFHFSSCCCHLPWLRIGTAKYFSVPIDFYTFTSKRGERDTGTETCESGSAHGEEKGTNEKNWEAFSVVDGNKIQTWAGEVRERGPKIIFRTSAQCAGVRVWFLLQIVHKQNFLITTCLLVSQDKTISFRDNDD